MGERMVLAAVALAASFAAVGDSVDVSLRLGAVVRGELTSLHFGVNAVFFYPGLADGTSVCRRAFASALKSAGIRALRFPGGNAAYFYLPESAEASMRLAHAIGHWEYRDENAPANRFTTLEGLAALCRLGGVKLIYELPMLFYFDGQRPRAAIASRLAERAGLFDKPRIAEGAAYAAKVARRLLELKAPVAAWELGNEEFAHCKPEDYAALAAEVIARLREIDPRTPIYVVGMGRGWLAPLVDELERRGALGEVSALTVHYPFGHWPGPPSPAERANPLVFFAGDVRFGRWLDKYAESLKRLGVKRLQVAVTETMVMRHQNWDAHAILPTHAHALCFAWNWLELLARPEVCAAVFHDLESPFFGIMRYDVGWDPARRRFVWLAAAERSGRLQRLQPQFRKRYVLSPTAAAMRLLSLLAGGPVRRVEISAVGVRALASDDAIVVVNRSERELRLSVPFEIAGAAALVAESPASALPGTYAIRRLQIRGGRVAMPGYCVAAILRGGELPRFSALHPRQ